MTWCGVKLKVEYSGVELEVKVVCDGEDSLIELVGTGRRNGIKWMLGGP